MGLRPDRTVLHLALLGALLFSCARGGAERTRLVAPQSNESDDSRRSEEPRPEPDQQRSRPPSDSPDDEHVGPDGRSPLDPRLLPHEPEGAIDITPRGPNRCVAQLELVAEVRGNDITLRGFLASNSDDAVKVTLRSTCPGGPIAFTGLGEGFDYYGACSAGACRRSSEPRAIVLPAGRGKVEIASTTFSLSGDACRPKLPPGTYAINGSTEVLFPEGATTCGSAFAQLTIFEPKRETEVPPRTCKPGPACGLACPGGRYAYDEHGCSLCACADDSPGGF